MSWYLEGRRKGGKWEDGGREEGGKNEARIYMHIRTSNIPHNSICNRGYPLPTLLTHLNENVTLSLFPILEELILPPPAGRVDTKASVMEHRVEGPTRYSTLVT